jgi:hypothetical protein
MQNGDQTDGIACGEMVGYEDNSAKMKHRERLM